MRFTKMQGCGNDYVYVNCLNEQVKNPQMTARRVSDRHFGIGSDGLILIKPSDVADFEMDMYNADGSPSPMCGNGIRCVAKYVYDYGLTDQQELSIATSSGVKHLKLLIKNGRVQQVRVNMGAPVFEAEQIPIASEHNVVIGERITVDGKEYHMTGVSMGNPHAVVFLEEFADLDSFAIEKTGPLFERHPRFPKRINTEFVKILDAHTVQMRVWERGSGETLACGTGACAVAAAAICNGLVQEGPLTVKLLGGELLIDWDQGGNLVYMTGPAEVVFDGEIEL